MNGIKDVAQKAGVSISTVSNVLNGKRYVSPELAQRVRAAARELAYEANPIAQRMKSNHSGIIGIITGDMYGVFYPYIVKGISEIATERGYQIVLSDARSAYGDRSAENYEFELFQQYINNRVDGIIFASVASKEHIERYCRKLLEAVNKFKPTPLVSLERDLTPYGIDSVYFDGFENSRMAVRHLIDCGCRKICHISGPGYMEIAEERIEGYLNVMNEYGLEVNERKMIAKGNYSHQGGYLAMKELLENVPDLDGIFCGNDQMAIGALKVLKEYGKEVPRDIKLIVYDDIFIASIVEPSLSTIHIKKKHAGIEAAKILLDRIENPGNCESVNKVLMDGRLVVRKSTMASAPEDWILSEW